MNRETPRASGSQGAGAEKSPSGFYDAAFLHFRSGRVEAAEQHCRQALLRDPKHADSLHLLGLIRASANRLSEAIDLIAEAIRVDPTVPDYFSNLGTLLQRLDRLEEALKSYDLALKLKPDLVDVWIRLGDLLRRQQRNYEALLTYDHVVAIDACNTEAINKGGLLLLELEQFEKALAKFDLLLTLQPGRAEVLDHRAICFSRLGRWEEAAASYRRSLEIAPDRAETHNSLGGVLVELHEYDAARQHFLNAIAIKPDFIAALNNLGIVLVDLKRFDEALSVYNQALSISAGVAEVLSNKAGALRGLGRLDEALACYDRAIALKPDYAQAHVNRGTCLDDMMRADEALLCYHRAIALHPGDAEAHWNLAINRLRAGDFRTGWLEGEWRWKCPALGLRERMFERPLWLGNDPIDGKTLLLHSDQGLGDALQFCRYVPLAAARGAQVILEVQPALRELLSSLAGVSRIVAAGEGLPDFDLHCSLASLPLAFGTELDSIPSDFPYLSADDTGRRWAGRLGSTGKPRIGLVWSGNPKHGNDQNRSLPLETLLPLFDLEAQFVSLQKEVRPDDQIMLRERGDILNLARELESLADTAALIAHLDLVISVDTSVAHLAGALGRPVWILLPYVPDWRWLLNRDDSPWYPTARLFRQTETREYPSVIGLLRRELEAWIDAQPRSPGCMQG